MNILLAGYSGLTGGFVLEQLRSHLRKESFGQGIAKIICIGRKPPSLNDKTEFVAMDNVVGDGASPEAHAFICCIGTTMAKAGSKEAFRSVDYEIPLRLSRWANGRASKFILMSSVGANAASGNFYLRVKGETEKAVKDSFRGSVYALRPSVLTGPRKETRVGERIGIAGATLVTPLLRGRWNIYRPVQAKDVAAAMVRLAITDEHPAGVYHYADIMRLARS